MNRLNPNLAAMLMSRLQQRTDMSGRPMLPQFAGQGGQGGMDPNLAAMLMASGQMGKHQNMQGQYMLPGGQGGSALDNQSFSGLDANRSMQRNPSSMDRYSNPTFSMGPARVDKPDRVAPVTSAEMATNNLEMAKWRRMAQEQKAPKSSYAPFGTKTDWAQGVSQAPAWTKQATLDPVAEFQRDSDKVVNQAISSWEPNNIVNQFEQDSNSLVTKALQRLRSSDTNNYQYQGQSFAPKPFDYQSGDGFRPNLNPQPPYVPQGPPMPEPYQPQSMFQRFGGGTPMPVQQYKPQPTMFPPGASQNPNQPSFSQNMHQLGAWTKPFTQGFGDYLHGKFPSPKSPRKR